jgi:hypothetical protein
VSSRTQQASLGRFEPRREYSFADGFSHPGQQVTVHAAHEVALLIDERVERTVREYDLTASHPRLVALLLQRHRRPISDDPGRDAYCSAPVRASMAVPTRRDLRRADVVIRIVLAVVTRRPARIR